MIFKKLLLILALTTLLAPTLVGCEQPRTLTIFSITGENVSVIKAGTDDWIEGEVGMSLGVRDTIKTDDDSGAEITFVDGSTIELQAGTEIEVDSLATTDTGSTTIVLKQTIGSIIFRVTKLIDPASRYEVETPTGVVAVRGSAVQVYVIEDGTTRAINLEGDIWAVAQGVELQVPEGRQCIIRPDEPPELIVEVTFADPNLEAAIRQVISKPEGPIYSSDMDGLTDLYAEQRSISNLSGLEHCTSMTRVKLWKNQISDISSLANLTSLTDLWLWGNRISDISHLTNLTRLTMIDLGNNQIKDVSPLADLTGLTTVHLESNEINDMSPLADLTDLTHLDLGLNQITDISSLANLNNLTGLGLSGHPIDDISRVVDLTKLTWLRLRDSQIIDISALRDLIGLTGLGLSSNRISDISPLASLSSLTYLDLEDNEISDISPLANLTSLTVLSLEHNQISDISYLTNLTSLMVLSLKYNQISDISPLLDNEGISEGDEVYLIGNPLSSDSINIYIPQLEARGVTVYY
jgi:Leucine-rich repeat (LRR) protein